MDKRKFSSVYLVSVGGAAIAFLILFWLGLAAIDHFGLLPPPQLSNNLCIDQKLAYLRGHPINQPTILTVGSSVAWRSFDSDVIREASNGRSMPLNGAFCGLKINQTEFATDYLLGRYPSVHSVVLILAPQDLTECSTTDPLVFNPNDADDLVFRHGFAFALYLRYFDPVTLVKNVFILRSMRDGRLPLDAMRINRYGDAPLDTNASRKNLVYGALRPFDADCLLSLRKLASDIKARGRRLIVVTMPLNPVWKAWYDPSGAAMQELTRHVENAIAGSGAIFWDANRDFPMDPGDFIDAIHIRWSAAKIFSQALVLATGLGGDTPGISND